MLWHYCLIPFQAQNMIPPSPAYSSLSSETDPSPHHSSFSPAHLSSTEQTTNQLNNKTINKTTNKLTELATKAPNNYPPPQKAPRVQSLSPVRMGTSQPQGSEGVVPKRKVIPVSASPSPQRTKICKVFPVSRLRP